MICITGDVHDDSLKTSDQKYLNISEVRAGEEYSNLAKKYNIKHTIFFTGRSIKNNQKIIKRLYHDGEFLEIGGHTWDAFRPKWKHRIFKLLTSCHYGPKFHQEGDIQKTKESITNVTGQEPVSWRTHAYDSNETTLDVLSENGFKVVSDNVEKDKIEPEKKESGILSLPINVMPDHEHLYHGARNKEHVKSQIDSGWRDSFGAKSYEIDEYFEIIKSQIERIERKDGVATLLLHPICMKIADNFNNFKKLCEWINENEYKTIKCKEILNYIDNVENGG